MEGAEFGRSGEEDRAEEGTVEVVKLLQAKMKILNDEDETTAGHKAWGTLLHYILHILKAQLFTRK